MIDVGEETGELDKMLMKIADNYETDVDVAVEGMSSLLEPMLIVGMGLVVGFIVIALFMPLIQIIQSIK
jgi:type IV pilus assembly protein PilC